MHAALGEAEVEAAMSGRIMDREKMKVELENVRIVGPVVEAITPDIVKKFIREKIEDMTPSEKLAYGVVGDAIVVIPIIKGATGVIKQAGEWVVLGKDIAGGAKKVFTKPDTPHHKTHTDTGGHNVDGDSHLGGSVNEFTNTNAQFSKKGAWGHWSDYEKVAINGKEYAKIGDWLYTRHAVENLYPSKMGRAPGHTSNHDHLNLPPKFVNDVLNQKGAQLINKGAREVHIAGDFKIVTEGNIVVTVMRVKR